MRIRTLALALAVALGLGLYLPVSAEETHPYGEASVNVRDVQTLLRGSETFRVKKLSPSDGGTQRVWKEETVTTDAAISLPLGTAFTTWFDSYELRAYTDSDGDGVYEMRLYWFPENGDGELLSAGEPEEGADGPEQYSSRFTGWDSNRLDFSGGADHSVYGKTLSAGWLTALFGPDTLLGVDFSMDGEPYHFYLYLTGEPIDPSALEGKGGLAVTEGGAVVSSWAPALIGRAEEAELIPEALYGMDLTQSMTRAQFAAVAVRLYEAMDAPYPPGWSRFDLEGNNPFSDVDASPFRSEIWTAYWLGLISGTGKDAFSPEMILTREQAAVILSNVYLRAGNDIPAADATSFADNASVAAWARSAVAFLTEQGVVSGVGDNRFAPQQTLSVQEALTMAVNLLERAG